MNLRLDKDDDRSAYAPGPQSNDKKGCLVRVEMALMVFVTLFVWHLFVQVVM